MDTRPLKMFCAVADSGSVVAASRRLHLTASAISHALKSLETEVGCRLFDRIAGRLILNQAGEQLLSQVREPLAALETAQTSLRRLSQWGQPRLRIAATTSLCHNLLPQVIKEMRKNFPNLRLLVESGDTPEAMEWLRTGRIDLAIGIKPTQPLGLELRNLFRDELLFVFSPTHPWSSQKTLTPDMIRTQPFILYRRATLSGRAIDAYFCDQDIAPETVMEVADFGAIKELVKLDVGVSILAPWIISDELARSSLCIRPLTRRGVWRHWVLLSRTGRRLSLAEETFGRLCRAHATRLRLDRRDAPTSTARPRTST